MLELYLSRRQLEAGVGMRSGRHIANLPSPGATGVRSSSQLESDRIVAYDGESGQTQ